MSFCSSKSHGISAALKLCGSVLRKQTNKQKNIITKITAIHKQRACLIHFQQVSWFGVESLPWKSSLGSGARPNRSEVMGIRARSSCSQLPTEPQRGGDHTSVLFKLSIYISTIVVSSHTITSISLNSSFSCEPRSSNRSDLSFALLWEGGLTISLRMKQQTDSRKAPRRNEEL